MLSIINVTKFIMEKIIIYAFHKHEDFHTENLLNVKRFINRCFAICSKCND